MATVLLVRHGRTTANTSGVLAGRSTGVKLDDVGIEQAARTADRLATVPYRADAVVTADDMGPVADAVRRHLDRQERNSPAPEG